MKLTWLFGEDKRAVIESTPMEAERFNTICGIIKCVIAGVVAVNIVSMTGNLGLLGVSCIALFKVVLDSAGRI